MKPFALAAFALTAFTVHAAPTRRAISVNDVNVLNFALTLEHLENAFYAEALQKFSEEDFLNAGLPSFAFGRFLQVASNERAHQALLEQVLGDQAVQPCVYNFPFTDPKSFATLSAALEGTGVSAYSGSAQFLSDKTFLTTAAVILSTEARHAAWVESAVNKLNAWSGPFDVALSMNEVFTLAASFIVSCPSSNPPLPVKAFPPLSITGPSMKPGSSVSVSFNSTGSSSAPTFLAFLTGLKPVFAPIVNGKATIPPLNGTVYAVVSSNGTAVSDQTILAGPTILEFPFDSQGRSLVQ